MLRLLALAAPLAAAAALAPPAAAAVTAVVTASATTGPAPLAVTLDASGSTTDQPGGIASWSWTFGDGTTATGPVVSHVYVVGGEYTATVVVRDAAGGAAAANVRLRATVGAPLTLAAPAAATTYGKGIALHGVLGPAGIPARRTLRIEAVDGPRPRTIAVVKTDEGNRWRAVLRATRPMAVRARWVGRAGPFVGATSPIARLRVRPAIRVGSSTAVALGSVAVRGTVAPARPGRRITAVVRRGGKVVARRSFALSGGRRFAVDLPAARAGSYGVELRLAGEPAFDPAVRTLRLRASLPSLAAGATGEAVSVLRRRLAALGYRQATGAASFGADLVDAVLAFQKVQGLPRTGAVGAREWGALSSPRAAQPRYPGHGDHLEVDKGRQVLLVVRGGRVAWVLPVSTGGYGRVTPVGTFSIIRKVPGFDPSPLGTLFDPMYFVGGYAIHGNPSVPSFPASHGCVRVPMWAASWLYATNGYGETVDVYA